MSLRTKLQRVLSKKTRKRRKYFPKPLFTESELLFFAQLREAVPEYLVFPQVSMGALIDPPPTLKGASRARARWGYQSKIVDYVIWDTAQSCIVCLVELDDRSHDYKKDKDAERDAMTYEAGLATIRPDVRDLPTIRALRKMILKAGAVTASRNKNESAKKPSGDFRRTLRVALLVTLLTATLCLAFLATHTMTRPTPLQSATAPKGADLKGFVIRHHPCMVYEDQDTISRLEREGCTYGEVTEFTAPFDEALLRKWNRYNQSRLSGNVGCEGYRDSADRILAHTTWSPDEQLGRLDRLYDSALMRGCLKAPKAQIFP